MLFDVLFGVLRIIKNGRGVRFTFGFFSCGDPLFMGMQIRFAEWLELDVVNV